MPRFPDLPEIHLVCCDISYAYHYRITITTDNRVFYTDTLNPDEYEAKVERYGDDLLALYQILDDVIRDSPPGDYHLSITKLEYGKQTRMLPTDGEGNPTEVRKIKAASLEKVIRSSLV